MRFALIGCGRISGNHITAALENKLQIVAVCDIIEERSLDLIDRFSLDEEWGTKSYCDYKKMIRENRFDLIAIATDSGKHAEIALYCIENKINVIIEKPIAMSIADADRIIEEATKNNVKVCANHQNRFNIAVQHLKNAIEEGRMGTISHGAVAVRWSREENYYSQDEWRGTWSQDGGTLMNQCIHGIDLLRWLLGDEVLEVYGATRRRFHDYIEAEDIGVAVVKFQNGAVATIEGTVNAFCDDMEETIYVFGEKGNVKLGGTSANEINIWQFANENAEDIRNKSLKEDTRNVYGNGHISLYNDMINAIVEDRKPYVDACAGKRALEMVLAIYKSQKTGQPVKLPLEEFSTEEMIGEF
ncbi:MAG: Inositol 2-dehydrogenase [Firmicutes bacterium ADurb.Bin300]|nr:MAG: Inositol 2-dehydrogenase [Firmicutes bacterium ADurb.Bin300]